MNMSKSDDLTSSYTLQNELITRYARIAEKQAQRTQDLPTTRLSTSSNTGIVSEQIRANKVKDETAKLRYEATTVLLDNGDRIYKDVFNALTPEQQIQIKTLGIDAFNKAQAIQVQKATEAAHLEIQTAIDNTILLYNGERVDKEVFNALSPEQQIYLKTAGTVSYNSKYAIPVMTLTTTMVAPPNSYQLDNGEYVDLTTFNTLPSEQQQYLKNNGTVAYNSKYTVPIVTITTTVVAPPNSIQLDNGEYVDLDKYNSMPQEQQQYLKVNGTIAYNDKYATSVTTTTTVMVAPPDSFQLVTGEYILQADWNKLTENQRAQVAIKGVDKFNEEQAIAQVQFEADNIKTSTGEWLSKNEYNGMTPTEQEKILTLGVNQYNTSTAITYATENTKLNNGEYVATTDFNVLTPTQQSELMQLGTTTFNTKYTSSSLNIPTVLTPEQRVAWGVLEPYIVYSGKTGGMQIDPDSYGEFTGYNIQAYLWDNKALGGQPLKNLEYLGFTSDQISKAANDNVVLAQELQAIENEAKPNNPEDWVNVALGRYGNATGAGKWIGDNYQKIVDWFRGYVPTGIMSTSDKLSDFMSSPLGSSLMIALSGGIGNVATAGLNWEKVINSIADNSISNMTSRLDDIVTNARYTSYGGDGAWIKTNGELVSKMTLQGFQTPLSGSMPLGAQYMSATELSEYYQAWSLGKVQGIAAQPVERIVNAVIQQPGLFSILPSEVIASLRNIAPQIPQISQAYDAYIANPTAFITEIKVNPTTRTLKEITTIQEMPKTAPIIAAQAVITSATSISPVAPSISTNMATTQPIVTTVQGMPSIGTMTATPQTVTSVGQSMPSIATTTINTTMPDITPAIQLQAAIQKAIQLNNLAITQAITTTEAQQIAQQQAVQAAIQQAIQMNNADIAQAISQTGTKAPSQVTIQQALRIAQQTANKPRNKTETQTALKTALKTVTQTVTKTATATALKPIKPTKPTKIKTSPRFPKLKLGHDDDDDEEYKAKLAKYAGAVTWRQGAFYKAWKYPYSDTDADLATFKEPPPSAVMVDGGGTPQETLSLMGKTAPPPDRIVDMGVVEFHITTDDNGNLRIKYSENKEVTRGDAWFSDGVPMKHRKTKHKSSKSSNYIASSGENWLMSGSV
jgi:hypothetical protein